MNTFSDKIFLGTSGWSYRDWIGPFYTKKDKSLLKAYSKVFRTVEIDSTFYRYPTKGTVMGWVKYSPEDFIYTAKLPKLITHTKKLDINEGIEEDLQKFIELMEPLYLSGKLGCILIQLPPKFDYKPQQIEEFFKILPAQVKWAVEFRDPSWLKEETFELLEKYHIAYTIVDEPLLPPEVHITSNIAYFRWHGHGARPWYNYRYRQEELEPWAPKIKEAAEKVNTVYGYFNNHYHGYAVENCLQILEMLGPLTPEQEEAKTTIKKYFKTTTKTKEAKLEAFVEPSELNFETLIRYFMDEARIKRAQQIKDNEVTIQQETPNEIRATVKEYHIVIDHKNRIVMHDCADWSKTLPNKRLCKHMGKLLLSLDRGKATTILRQIFLNKESWEFKPYTEQ
ncbi:DUF72 domain-containing protein [Candidatus Bathyarchaeota archaeon]|nr:DUF72 domain-containing protein [Candidatus Bathyarchaeota archaeon]